jgi:hypothetical protein
LSARFADRRFTKGHGIFRGLSFWATAGFLWASGFGVALDGLGFASPVNRARGDFHAVV